MPDYLRRSQLVSRELRKNMLQQVVQNPGQPKARLFRCVREDGMWALEWGNPTKGAGPLAHRLALAVVTEVGVRAMPRGRGAHFTIARCAPVRAQIRHGKTLDSGFMQGHSDSFFRDRCVSVVAGDTVLDVYTPGLRETAALVLGLRELAGAHADAIVGDCAGLSAAELRWRAMVMRLKRTILRAAPRHKKNDLLETDQP
jgi:hypothetical protein